MSSPTVRWRWLGRVDYATARRLQEGYRDRVLAGDPEAEVVLLLEHDPVITLGRSADPAHVVAGEAELARRGIPVVRTRRGGDVTYHGPGQLMVYPVVRLRRGVVAFLESVARALAEVAAHYGVHGAAWRRDPAGLWIGDAKLAACGIHLRRGVTSHGWAFNVATPPDAWSLIVPCGLRGARQVSLADRAPPGRAPASVAEVAEVAGPIVARAVVS